MKKIICFILLIVLVGCSKETSITNVSTTETTIQSEKENEVSVSITETTTQLQKASEVIDDNEKELSNKLAEKSIKDFNDFCNGKPFFLKGTALFYDLNCDENDEFFFLFGDGKNIWVVIYQIKENSINQIGKFNYNSGPWEIHKNDNSVIIKTNTIYYNGAYATSCYVEEKYIECDSNLNIKNNSIEYTKDLKTDNKIDDFSYVLGDEKTKLSLEKYSETVREILGDSELTDAFVVDPFECENINDKKIFSNFIYNIIKNK